MCENGEANQQKHEHNAQLVEGIQLHGKDLRCYQRKGLQQNQAVPEPD